MTTEEWIAANLAAAPPLTPAQMAILRPILRPVVLPRIQHAAPAGTRAARTPEPEPERTYR